jgi:hypothetical protein
VDTPIEECERRDVKGLYKKARAGLIKVVFAIIISKKQSVVFASRIICHIFVSKLFLSIIFNICMLQRCVSVHLAVQICPAVP